jgi:SAM-dependent methyltransferase
LAEQPSQPDARIDTAVPHSARIWNYWLGGTDNLPVDRAAGDQWAQVQPDIVDIARTSRAFLDRAVAHLAGELGLRQFLDVGAGLPAANNTHQVAQRVAPDARVVYVDDDPLVVAHGRELLAGAPGGTTRYLEADLHDPEKLITAAADVLDFDQPVAVLFMGVLGHVHDVQDARSIVARVLDRVPSGSYLALCDGVYPEDPEAAARTRAAEEDYAATGAVAYFSRTTDGVRSLFDGLEFVEPGLSMISFWRPDTGPAGTDAAGQPHPIDMYGGVARKP